MELIQTLENPDFRITLIDILSNRETILKQENLFGEGISIEPILDEFLSLLKSGRSLYQRWVQKIGDKERPLSVPNKPLRNLIENYLLPFIKQGRIHKKCHGAEKGWSVEKSLRTHVPCASVLSFDLKSAFQSIPLSSVSNLFYSILPPQLPEEEKRRISKFFTEICSVNYSTERGLPQGSPCSMAIFNRTLYDLDCLLDEKAGERGLRYSRWVDDITMSSPRTRGIGYFLGAVELTEHQFPVSREKIFFQDRKEVYLLGHKINEGKITKNTKEERLQNKSHPLIYGEWFDNNKERMYEPWI